MLRKNIFCDSEILKWLENYSDVVTISVHPLGGLEIDVHSKIFHKDPTNYSRIKYYLKSNGFDSFCGVATRRKISKNMSNVDFIKLNQQLTDDINKRLGIYKTFPLELHNQLEDIKNKIIDKENLNMKKDIDLEA